MSNNIHATKRRCIKDTVVIDQHDLMITEWTKKVAKEWQVAKYFFIIFIHCKWRRLKMIKKQISIYPYQLQICFCHLNACFRTRRRRMSRKLFAKCFRSVIVIALSLCVDRTPRVRPLGRLLPGRVESHGVVSGAAAAAAAGDGGWRPRTGANNTAGATSISDGTMTVGSRWPAVSPRRTAITTPARPLPLASRPPVVFVQRPPCSSVRFRSPRNLSNYRRRCVDRQTNSVALLRLHARFYSPACSRR